MCEGVWSGHVAYHSSPGARGMKEATATPGFQELAVEARAAAWHAGGTSRRRRATINVII